MTLNSFGKLGYKWFGPFAERKVTPKLKQDLYSAHMDIRPGAYLSMTLLYTILGVVISFISLSVLILVLLPLGGISLDIGFIILFLILPLPLGVGIYFGFLRELRC